MPKDWEHPRDARGRYRPMFIESYKLALEKWLENHRLWEQGRHPAQKDYPEETRDCKFYAEWSGNPPSVEYYNPYNWSKEEANCFQVYENVTEGTPLSPVFESLKQVEHWLVAGLCLDRRTAKELCRTTYSPTFSGSLLVNGKDALKNSTKKKPMGTKLHNKRNGGL